MWLVTNATRSVASATAKLRPPQPTQIVAAKIEGSYGVTIVVRAEEDVQSGNK